MRNTLIRLLLYKRVFIVSHNLIKMLLWTKNNQSSKIYPLNLVSLVNSAGKINESWFPEEFSIRKDRLELRQFTSASARKHFSFLNTFGIRREVNRITRYAKQWKVELGIGKLTFILNRPSYTICVFNSLIPHVLYLHEPDC